MRNIVLVGFMGTGKTVVGKALANHLGREFLELDEIIEKKEGTSIKEIFEKKGEPYFRKLEKDVIKEISVKNGVVVSAGGGAIVDEENLTNLKRYGTLICLEASPDTILSRIGSSGSRPLLNVPDPKNKIEELLKKRKAFYKKSDFLIMTDNLTVDKVVEEIKKLVT
ncbi:MAG: shikimate kinase [Candidatus Omnitrophota bacterium]